MTYFGITSLPRPRFSSWFILIFFSAFFAAFSLSAQASPAPSQSPISSQSPAPSQSPAADETQPDQAAGSLQTDDSGLDSLFQDSAGTGTVTVDNSSNDLLNQFVQEKGLTVTGAFKANTAAAAGWLALPDLSGQSQTGFSGWDANLGATFDATISLDARPDPAFRFHVTAGADWTGPTDSIAPDIRELFIDLSLQDVLFLRLGKHTVNWGQARILTYDNLINQIPDGEGITLKATLPAGPFDLNGYLIARDTFFTNSANPALTQVGYAFWTGLGLSPFDFGAGIVYQEQTKPRILVSAKTSVLGIDLFAELTVLIGSERKIAIESSPGVYSAVDSPSGLNPNILAGFFWEEGSINFQLYGEYFYHSQGSSDPGYLEKAHEAGADETITGQHYGALAFRFKNIGGSSLQAGLQWIQNFSDGSGNLTPGISFDPFQHVNVDLGLRWTYGSDWGQYVVQNDDTLKRRLFFIVNIDISGDYRSSF